VVVCWAYWAYDNQKTKYFYGETKIIGNAMSLRAVTKKLPVKLEVSVSTV
jgi:hypothetical protein